MSDEAKTSARSGIKSDLVGIIVSPKNPMVGLSLQTILFLKLMPLWALYLVSVGLSLYFALPLLGIGILTSLLTMALAAMPLWGFALAAVAIVMATSVALATIAFYPPFTANLLTNANVYRWRDIPAQIVARAYKRGKAEWQISPWQIFNLLAHLHFWVGGLQLIVNKAFHQLYNKRFTYEGADKAVELPRGFWTEWALAFPRFVLALAFLLVMLPLNLSGSLIEQLNYMVFNLSWYCSDHASYLAAHEQVVEKKGVLYSLFNAGASVPLEAAQEARQEGDVRFLTDAGPVRRRSSDGTRPDDGLDNEASVAARRAAILEAKSPPLPAGAAQKPGLFWGSAAVPAASATGTVGADADDYDDVDDTDVSLPQAPDPTYTGLRR